ncbi:NKG2-D type II integral membrane protein isoform X3 [Vombatus ursinus]|uniref:NKG2-D type II integral membrane protein n=1 Tax=Vombatus ursinus TaxID=29139 RepID=A0A4X2KKE5_VOMUR|nr:NKG2-D type II integral membrane protein isoform X3 [Vombatus ursinus]
MFFSQNVNERAIIFFWVTVVFWALQLSVPYQDLIFSSHTKDFPTSLRTFLLRAETSEQQDSKSTVASRFFFTKRQEGSLTRMRNKYTANESLLFLRRFIAVVMGIKFFVMLAMLGTIFIYSSNPKAPSNANGFYCGPCPKNWVCYKNNCYLFSNESKSWDQSRASCLSHNSSLLKIYSREDQDFLALVKSYHWMGLVQPTPSGFWMWEDGSPFSPDLVNKGGMMAIKLEVWPGHCKVAAGVE